MTCHCLPPPPARAMTQPVPRLSVPAALALGSAALGAAFATGLFLGEQDPVPAGGRKGGRGVAQVNPCGRRALYPDPVSSPRQEGGAPHGEAGESSACFPPRTARCGSIF